MPRCLLFCPFVLILAVASPQSSRASEGQPWYNMILCRDKCRGREQARLQQFWNGYYQNLSVYYQLMSNLDWASYYKNHGGAIGYVSAGNGGPSYQMYGPIDINPPIPWGIRQTPVPPWLPPDVPWGPGRGAAPASTPCDCSH